MLMPEVAFRVMKLPFGLRWEMFFILLRRSCLVLQFPPDRPADALRDHSM